MHIDIAPARKDEAPMLANLMELYLYDFTEFTDEDVADDGRFGFQSLDEYWTNDGCHPFLLRIDEKLAGFALLKRGSRRTGDAEAMDIAEFFVMRKYRRLRAGEAMARILFDRFPGRWEVRQVQNNLRAQAFWRAIIHRYTGGAFEERTPGDGQGPMQLFDNSRFCDEAVM